MDLKIHIYDLAMLLLYSYYIRIHPRGPYFGPINLIDYIRFWGPKSHVESYLEIFMGRDILARVIT